jgi:hypothetical protein
MNYGELKTLVRNYIHDVAGSETDGMIPDFIELGLSQINREVRSRWNTSTALFNDFGGTGLWVLPSNYMEAIDLYYVDGDYRRTVRFSTRAAAADWTGVGTDGISPNTSGVDYNMIYYYRESMFASDASTHNLLTYYPKLYLWSALVEAYTYMMDDARRDNAMQMFSLEVDRVNYQDQKERFGNDIVIEGVA